MKNNNNNNSKATIREVRDLIDKLDDEKITPMRENIVSLTIKIDNLCNSISEKHNFYLQKFDENKSEHLNFISIKTARNITVFLSIFMTILTIINGFLTFYGGF